MFNAFTQQDDGQTKHLLLSDNFGMVVDAVNVLQPLVIGSPGPYLIEDYRLGYCKKGYIRSIIDLQEYVIKEGMLIVIAPGSIVEPVDVSPDLTLTGMGVSEERMQMAFRQTLPDMLCGHRRDFLLTATAGETRLVEQLFALMWNLANDRTVKQQTLDNMISVVGQAYDDIFRSHGGDGVLQSDAPNRQHELYQKFIALVNEHCCSERQLDFYADRLCITRRHLGTVVREVSGITAKEWIDRAVITAAKVMLRHTDKTVAQIADELHFPTDSFFCKYFKRITAQSPLDWRRG